MKSPFYTPKDSITLSVGGDVEIILTKTGFYVNGNLIKRDLEIYENFKQWLDNATNQE